MVKGALKPAKEDPQFISVDLDTAKADIGDLAKAVGNCTTPHKDKVAPCLAVAISVKGLTKGDAAKVQKALEGIKGVVAMQSRAEQGEAIIFLDGKGGAKLSDIKKALDKLAA